MRKRALIFLAATLICLGIFSQHARAGDPRGFSRPAKPDLEITQIAIGADEHLTFTIVSHGASVPANTVAVLIMIREKDSKAMFYDLRHDFVIDQELPADAPKTIEVQMPQGKRLGNRKFNLVIDPDNKIDESNEDNNVTQTQDGLAYADFPTGLDMKLKDAIYFHLGQPDSQAGEPGKPLKVKKSQTQGCPPKGWCAVLTVRVLKEPADQKLVTKVDITNVTTGDQNDGSILLDAGVTEKDFTFVISLKDGNNKIRVELNQDKQDNEMNYNNNVLEFPVTLVDK